MSYYYTTHCIIEGTKTIWSLSTATIPILGWTGFQVGLMVLPHTMTVAKPLYNWAFPTQDPTREMLYELKEIHKQLDELRNSGVVIVENNIITEEEV